MRKLFKILTITSLCFCLLSFTACSEMYEFSQAHRVSINVQRDANRFNVERRLVVYNARTDMLVLELCGYFALSNNNTNELQVTCEVGNGVYKVNYIYLTENIIYFVEDISGAHVDKYHYELNYCPEMIIPVTVVVKD